MIPSLDIDFYSDAVIRDPLPTYEQMREAGPVVWLGPTQVYAVARDAEVRDVLRRADVFRSGRGLSLNDDVNALLIGSTLNSDDPVHRQRRSVTALPIMPKSIEPLRQYIRELSQALADDLSERGQFDAVRDFAQVLPLAVVIDLVGLNASGGQNMLKWAAATFNLFEGFNARSHEAMADLKDLQAFLEKYGRRDALKEGGLAQRIFDVAPGKGFNDAEAAQLMRDYINPSLDTTISAAGFAAFYFATQPEQWDILRTEPDLIPNAVEEIVRLATPIRAFSRYVSEDTQIGDAELAQGTRILAIYASANRDPRMWDNPDNFDVRRATRKHLGFGHGAHTCMGLHLARLELTELLSAMLPKVSAWHLDGTPEISMNNTIRAFAHLRVKVTPA